LKDLQNYLTVIPAALIAISIHEMSHAWAAWLLGDRTAQQQGRLNLNPLSHIDPVGFLCMIFFGFGWAKPVPVNPRNFRNYRRDDFLVSIAGVTVNLSIFITCVLLSCLINPLLWNGELLGIMQEEFGSAEVLLNPYYDWVLTFNGMDGELGAISIMYAGHEMIPTFGLFMEHSWLVYIQRALLLLAQVNLTLAVFNLLPIPPLDGFHVVNDLLLKGRLQLNYHLHQITRVALMALLFTGVLDKVLSFCNTAIYQSVLRTFMILTGQL
jgi:Zn-dependent protease